MRPHDRIIVEETASSSLRPGDLILFYEQGRPVCHRLVRKSRLSGQFMLFARGDYSPSWKTVKVDQERCAGRVTAIVRGKRIIPAVGFREAAVGRLIVISFPLAMLIFMGLRRLIKK